MCRSDCERARIRSRFVRSKLMTSFSAMHRRQVQAESHSQALETERKECNDLLRIS
jgi:hypothetical protein